MVSLSTFTGGRITINQIYDQIDLIQHTERYLLLMGAPGIGKSASVIKYANDHGWKLFTFTGGIISRPQIYGVDFPNYETQSTMHLVSNWYKEAIKFLKDNPGKKVLLFLDDLANASPQEAMILQQMLGERTIGELPLPVKDFVIVGATNRAQDSRSISEITSPIRSRGSIVEVDLDHKEFIEYAMKEWHPSVITFLEQASYALSDNDRYLAAGHKQPGDLKNYGPKGADSCTVHPCPRTWKAVSDILITKGSSILDSGRQETAFKQFVSGCVGEALTEVFFISLKGTLNVPSYEQLNAAFVSGKDFKDMIADNIESVSATAYNIYQILARALKSSVGDSKEHIKNKALANEALNILDRLANTKFKKISVAAVVDMLMGNIGVGEDKFSLDEIQCLTKNPIFRENISRRTTVQATIQNAQSSLKSK